MKRGTATLSCKFAQHQPPRISFFFSAAVYASSWAYPLIAPHLSFVYWLLPYPPRNATSADSMPSSLASFWKYFCACVRIWTTVRVGICSVGQVVGSKADCTEGSGVVSRKRRCRRAASRSAASRLRAETTGTTSGVQRRLPHQPSQHRATIGVVPFASGFRSACCCGPVCRQGHDRVATCAARRSAASPRRPPAFRPPFVQPNSLAARIPNDSRTESNPISVDATEVAARLAIHRRTNIVTHKNCIQRLLQVHYQRFLAWYLLLTLFRADSAISSCRVECPALPNKMADEKPNDS